MPGDRLVDQLLRGYRRSRPERLHSRRVCTALLLHHDTGARFHDRDGDDGAVLRKNLGHTEFLSQNRFLHDVLLCAAYSLISMSTPAGRSSCISASTVLLVGCQNVDQALMGAHLELLARVLVLMRSTQDRDDLLFRRQRDGARYPSARALGGIHDALGSHVDQRCARRP